MKVKLLSDLHLEFQDEGEFLPGEGDVLILAGDICTASDLGRKGKLSKRYKKFFNRCVESYNKIFYVLGNHEHYNFIFDKTEDVIRENIPEGITLLQDQSEFYNGWHFVGSTMWAGFEDANIVSMSECQSGMNDYRCVHINKNNQFTQLTPIHTLQAHIESVKWFNQCLPTLNGPVFMITHHAPSYRSFDGYREEGVMGAYATPMESFIEKHPSIKFWGHGHIHSTSNYMIGNCNVVSNPRGYFKYETNIAFDEEMSLDLESPQRQRVT